MRSEQVWLPTNALELELDFFYLRRPTSATQLLLLVRDDRKPPEVDKTRSEGEDPNTKIQDPKKLQIPKLQWATQTWP